MMRYFLKRFDIFITNRSWFSLAILFVLFATSYPFPFFYKIAEITAIVLILLSTVDLLLLIIPGTVVSAERKTSEKWSLADENKVHIFIKNNTYLFWKIIVLDELPPELQKRDLVLNTTLEPKGESECEYTVIPVKRGIYSFGKLRIFIASPLGFFNRRESSDLPCNVAVYPSIVQMKKYSLLTIQKIARYYGVKKLRRIGHSYEFEQIKEYVRGDDLRHINWKATGRSTAVKTNHFTEEKAQPVYCIIDKSRVMNLAFNNLSLLDYAINASLVICNTVLQKGDRAGLITFSDKVGTAIRADNGPGTLNRLLDSLYLQKYRQSEADFEFLFTALGRVANTRSLLFLFTNFESIYALQRNLPVLRKMNNKYLLVVIFFENAELENYAYEKPENFSEIYSRSIARQMVSDKRQMMSELHNHGIQALITKPQDLTINTLNKYLELKSKGLI